MNPPPDHILKKWREVRDVYNKLMKRYKYVEVVLPIILDNYFITEHALMGILKKVDTQPVGDNPSYQYQTMMNPDFKL